MSEIWRELRPKQVAIDSALRSVLERFTVNCPDQLAEAMRYSLLAPGKRLRPVLTALTSEAVGGTLEQSLAAGCAVEMVHTYSLIHDDLPAMDNDDLRRGLPTSHKQFGEALAILAGDALLTLAFEVLAASYPSKTASVMCIELARGAGASGMVGGQVLDLQAEGRIAAKPVSSIADLEAIHRAKTGALFRTSLRLGIFAVEGETGVDSRLLASIDAFADAFGLAFQVTDDLLDVESTAEATGKRVGKDAARGKLTYPGLLGIEASRQKSTELVRSAIQATQTFGERGKPLAQLAEFLVARDR